MLKPPKMILNGSMNKTSYTFTSMVETILQNNRRNYLVDPIKIVPVHCSSSYLVDSDWKWGKGLNYDLFRVEAIFTLNLRELIKVMPPLF